MNENDIHPDYHYSDLMFHIQCPHLCFFSPSSPLTILPLQQCLQKYFVIYSCIFVMIFFLNVFFWKYATRSAGMFFCISIFYLAAPTMHAKIFREIQLYFCNYFLFMFSFWKYASRSACMFFLFLFLYHANPTMPAKIFREIQLYFCNDFLFKRFFLEIC